MYQQMNVTAPTNRAPQIAQLAQQAAQNVMRRQRLKALVHQGAIAGGGSQTAGMPNLLNVVRSMQHANSAAQGGYGRLTSMVGGNMNNQVGQQQGIVNPGNNGGFDFSSLPDPNDPSQSPASTVPNSIQGGGPVANKTDWSGASSQTPVASKGDWTGTGVQTPQDPAVTQAEQQSQPVLQPGGLPMGLIPLGNGLHYDPVSDTIRGPGAVGTG